MTAWKSVQFGVEYACFRLVAGLLGALPLDWASGLGGASWRLIAPLTSRHRRAVNQLALGFPEKSRADCDRIARDMWENMGRTFAEFFHLEELAKGERFTVETPDLARAIAGGPEGFVLVSMHFGNWEIAAMGMPPSAHGLAGVYQRIKNPRVDAWVLQRRKKYYLGGLFAKGPNAGIQLVRHLRRGGGIALMADLRDNGGPRVPFFGRPAPSTPFPAMLARGCGGRLYAGTVRREAGARFSMRLDPVDVPKTDDREGDIVAATANLAAKFEAAIRAHPEQWMWAHRRWG